MPRIRTIKPEFWTNEKLSELPEIVHLFAAAVLNHCDDEGYFNANIRLLDSQIFPLREPSLRTHCILSELSVINYLEIYEGKDGREYGKVVNFTEHQKVNRPTPSKIKGLCLRKKELTEDSRRAHGGLTEDSLRTHGGLTVGKERKGTGKGTGKGKESGASAPLPEFIDQNLFDEYLAVRKSKKYPNTKNVLNRLRASLEKYEGVCKGYANKSLHKAIKGGYQDVYEPKEGQFYQKTSRSTSTDQEIDYSTGVGPNGNIL